MLKLRSELPIRVAVVAADGVRVDDDPRAFDELSACAARYRERYAARGITAPGSVEGVEHARELFRLLRIDATRHRPSSEALLNRALKGKPMPRISSLVDAGNWCSLEMLLPLGVYDRDLLRGDVALREGEPGASYAAISGRDISLAGRYLLADDEGPFGSPMTDSLRTAVGETTRRTAIVLYAPDGYDTDRLAGHAATLGARIVACCGGEIVQEEVVR